MRESSCLGFSSIKFTSTGLISESIALSIRRFKILTPLFLVISLKKIAFSQ